jgi:3-oxoacyl-[acyl-carrier protein] reductase
MEDQVCIVTGAGRGIGRQVALLLAQRGYHIIANSRSRQELDQTAATAGETGAPTGTIVPVAGDIGRPVTAATLVEDAVQRFGRVDAVAHCAGAAPLVPLEKTTDSQWDQALATNLSGAFYLMRAVWPVMQRQRGGVIVNISSQAARDPFVGFAAYAAAKAGLHGLALVAAREGARHGIRIHTVAPGAVETTMLRALWPPEKLPPAHCLQPEDVARVVVGCITGELRHLSGEVLWMRQTTG